MSVFGAEFYDETGQLYLGADYWATPIVDIIDGTYFGVSSSTYVVSYPQLPGATLRARVVPNKHYYIGLPDDTTPVTMTATFDYTAGYPVATYTLSSMRDPDVVLEISIQSALSDHYGYQMFNAGGELSAGAASMSYVFLGKFAVPNIYSLYNSTLESYPSSEGKYAIEYRVVSGQAMWTHEITLPASLFGSSSRPILLVDIPNAPAGVRQHTLRPKYTGNTPTGGWVLRLAVIGGFSPSVYVFDREKTGVPPVSMGYGMEVFNSAGQMTFSTNQKMLTSLPRQVITLTTPKNGNGTYSTIDTYTLPALSGSGRPLLSPSTPRNMLSVNKHSKNYADLHGYWSKFWSKDVLGNLQCKWVNVFADAYVGKYPYDAMVDYAGGFTFEASNSVFYD